MKYVLSVILFLFSFVPLSFADSISVDKDVKKEAALISGPRKSDGETVCRKFLLVSSEKTVERNFDSTGNMLKDTEGCRSEVALFSESHGALLRKDVTRWSNKDNDDLYLDPPDLIQIPTVVWVVHGDKGFLSNIFKHEKNETKKEVKNANKIFKKGKCGFEIEVKEYVDKTETLNKPNQKVGCGMFNNLLKKKIGYRPKRMNVYLVGRLKSSDRAGVACKEETANVILMDKGRGDVTLAHELGHWLSLNHTNTEENPMPLVNTRNIMSKTDIPDRSMITAGQCYRANFDKDSYLNTSGLRNGPTKTCEDKQDADENCPGLKKEF